MTAKTPEPFPTLKDLPLDAIRTDGGTQPRERIDADVVHEYAERMREGDRFPRVSVYFDGTDHWLSDGFHRVKAAIEAGQTTIQAEVWEGTRDDAFWMSLGANKTHGLPRSNADKERAVKAALRTRPGKSNREIAEHVGVVDAFRRRHEMQALVLAVMKVKSTVLKAVEAKDPLYTDILPTQFQADCGNVIRQLKAAMPHAACPYCRAAGCKACHGRGWIGELAWNAAPRELKS